MKYVNKNILFGIVIGISISYIYSYLTDDIVTNLTNSVDKSHLNYSQHIKTNVVTSTETSRSNGDVSRDLQLQEADVEGISEWINGTLIDQISERTQQWESEHGDTIVIELMQLGLDQETANKFMKRRKSLYTGAVVSGDSRLQLIENRHDYIKDLERTLSPEAFQEYKYNELLKPANRELDLIQAKAITNGSSISEESMQNILNAIVETGMTTTESWDGPFDPLPTPKAGTVMMQEKYEHQHQKLMNNVDVLFDQLTDLELPVNDIELVQTYYIDKINNLAFNKELFKDEKLAMNYYRELTHLQTLNSLELRSTQEIAEETRELSRKYLDKITNGNN